MYARVRPLFLLAFLLLRRLGFCLGLRLALRFPSHHLRPQHRLSSDIGDEMRPLDVVGQATRTSSR